MSATASSNNDGRLRRREDMAGRERRHDSASPRILLVDEDRRFSELVEALLHTAGEFEVSRVVSITSALRILAERPVDVVVTDLRLPDTRGIDAVRRIHGAVSGTPIIVLTAVDDDATAVDAVSEGADLYLVKGSTDLDALPRWLRNALEQHRRIADEEARRYADVVVDLRSRAEIEEIARILLEVAPRSDLCLALVLVRHDLEGDDKARAALTLRLADVLRRTFRHSDFIARLHHNELGVLLVGRTSNVEPAIERMRDAIAETRAVAIRRGAISVGCSVLEPDEPTTLNVLVKRAGDAVRPLA